MESSYCSCQSLELSPTAWNVGWGLDAVHQPLFVVLYTISSELSLGLTAISVCHVDFFVCRHQVLKVAILLLLFLSLLFGLAFGKVMLSLNLSLGRPCSLLAL